jgi:hypothetical protein
MLLVFGLCPIAVVEQSPIASSSDHITLFVSDCNFSCTFSLSRLMCYVIAWGVSAEKSLLNMDV